MPNTGAGEGERGMAERLQSDTGRLQNDAVNDTPPFLAH